MRYPRLFPRRYARPGSSPGTLLATPGAPPTRIAALHYHEGAIEELASIAAADVPALLARPGIVWIDVQGFADVEALRQVADAAGIHPLALADAVNTGQRPKCEPFNGSLFIVTQTGELLEGEAFSIDQLSLFVTERAVITFQQTPGDCLGELRDRLRQGRGVIRSRGSGYLACMILDAVVDGYFPVLEGVAEEIERLEARVLDRADRHTVEGVFRVKRELTAIRRAVWPLREALTALLRDEHPVLPREVLPYLRDSYDHAAHIVDLVETYRELSASLIEVYLSTSTMQTNEIMRVLTVISTIFIPLTFLAGVYGMNFDRGHPLNMPELGWPLGYVVFWTLCGAIAIGMLAMFRRLGWLRLPRGERRRRR